MSPWRCFEANEAKRQGDRQGGESLLSAEEYDNWQFWIRDPCSRSLRSNSSHGPLQHVIPVGMRPAECFVLPVTTTRGLFAVRAGVSVGGMLTTLRAARRLQSHGLLRCMTQQPQWPPRLNVDLLSLREVRLISESGEDRGIVAARKALSEAREAGRDLMEVNRYADPPVVRLVDFQELQAARAKKMYDARKQRKESRKKERKEGALKQVRLSPATDTHDMQNKLRQAREFLREGHRVRIYMQFRRGQGRLQDDAKAALIAAAEQLQEVGKVQGIPSGGGIPDLFRQEERKDEEDEPVQPIKRKPMEVLIQPLSRKQRELLDKAETEAES